jgi:hypothetical protein
VEVCVRVGTRCVGEGYLAKIGIKGMPSNLATAARTAVVLVFAWMSGRPTPRFW